MNYEFHISTLGIVACLISYFSYVWGWNSCVNWHTEEESEYEDDE